MLIDQATNHWLHVVAFRMGSDSTKERSLGGVGGRRVIFLSGVAMLFQRGTVVAFQKSFRYLPSGFMVLSEHGAHIFGALAIAVSLVIVWFYFRSPWGDRPR